MINAQRKLTGCPGPWQHASDQYAFNRTVRATSVAWTVRPL